MGQAIAVRTDYTSGQLRQLAKRAKEAAQARRLLAIAAVLDGASREEAATAGGMDRQTLRDWVIRFNKQGPDGLINLPSPGAPGKLNGRAQGISRPPRGGGPDSSSARRGALAGLRSDHAVIRGIWALGLGRHGIPRFEGSGLLACEREAEGLPAGRQRHRCVQKNFATRVAEIRQTSHRACR